ncbi:hypothetical protein KC331_g3561 [Hortaea werneckii]|nr:hypothetical protein KC331_g3561 [Hortaea werneckii]KAI7719436.1 hypothetical protein KC353_g2986 [Hortaea werneckii]
MLRAFASLATCASLARAAVEVYKTNKGPTGYEVKISYTNSTVHDVKIGGLPHFTDQWRTTFTYAASFDPHNYKAGDFLQVAQSSPPSIYQMNSTGEGHFEFTTPLPSGTYQYYFLLDCANVTTCSQASGQQVPDPENPPYETVKGSEQGSPFQVPYDPQYQYYPDYNLNFDYTLPIADVSQRGTLKKDLYRSPGAVSPSPGMHDFVVYLPAGYSNTSSQKYPLLYLSHGGGGAAGDWENQGYMSHIMDRLIQDNHVEPTVVVMPTFNGLLNVSNPPANVVRPLYQKYLFPYIEANYHVTTDPARRAFAGLSLGSVLTYEMYINATSYFGYYGFFSGALLPNHPQSDYVNSNVTAQNPDLLDRGILIGYGQYDIAFDDAKKLQAALDSVGIKYVNRFLPWGFHWWNMWQDHLWNFGRTTLWKERPFGEGIAHGLRGT